MSVTTLEKRAAAANEVIDIISRHGRQFFYSPIHERNSRFDVDRHGQIWYVDEHTGLRMSPLAGIWIGFSKGLKAQKLILAIAEYIDTGQKIPYQFFREEWGYGRDMLTVRKAVIKTKAVEKEPIDAEHTDQQAPVKP